MQEHDDLRFMVDDSKWFGVRAAVLLRHGQDVLVRAMPLADGQTGYLIPGGGVKFGESALEAGAREMHEELQLDGLQMTMAGVVENFWPINAKVDGHQIVMFMSSEVTDAEFTRLQHLDPSKVDLPDGVKMVWLPWDDIRDSIRPAKLGRALGTGQGIQYGVDRRKR